MIYKKDCVSEYIYSIKKYCDMICRDNYYYQRSRDNTKLRQKNKILMYNKKNQGIKK